MSDLLGNSGLGGNNPNLLKNLVDQNSSIPEDPSATATATAVTTSNTMMVQALVTMTVAAAAGTSASVIALIVSGTSTGVTKTSEQLLSTTNP